MLLDSLCLCHSGLPSLVYTLMAGIHFLTLSVWCKRLICCLDEAGNQIQCLCSKVIRLPHHHHRASTCLSANSAQPGLMGDTCLDDTGHQFYSLLPKISSEKWNRPKYCIWSMMITHWRCIFMLPLNHLIVVDNMSYLPIYFSGDGCIGPNRIYRSCNIEVSY
jgi:hypothetical protein